MDQFSMAETIRMVALRQVAQALPLVQIVQNAQPLRSVQAV
jgi:hypothetical protein